MKKKMLLACFFLYMASQSMAQSFEQRYTITTPDYSINENSSRQHSVHIDGYYTDNVPGTPCLPIKKIRIAIHPDADIESIQLTYKKDRISTIGQYNLLKLPVMATWQNNQQIVSKKADISSNNTFFPHECIAVTNISQLRKWKIVSLTYRPFQYHPVSKILRMVHSVNVTLSYQITTTPQKSRLTQDNVMTHRIKNMIDNADEAIKLYGTGKALNRSEKIDYIIITTNKIVSKSLKLTPFMNHLTLRGFHPRIVTETDFSHLDAQHPNGRAEKIRQWLKDHYLKYAIEYVLLIGDPTPDDPTTEYDNVGDIPMKMCWPMNDNYNGNDRDAPTDYFYADLTGNWDLNGDGIFGDSEHDSGVGGVDFMNEVYVGRIPVYHNNIGTLDKILEKTIQYTNESNTKWRKNILMPMSFLDPKTDSAKLAEAMITDYLKEEGFDYWRQYMKGSVCRQALSIYEPEEELLYGVTIDKWKSSKFGMVWWSGHGDSQISYIGYNHDCDGGFFMLSAYSRQLNDNYPAFVFLGSCKNGFPEDSSNLQFSVLKQGAVIAYASSRTSWYIIGNWSPDDHYKYYCDNYSIAYELGKNLVQQKMDAGKALYDLKSDMGENNIGKWVDGSHWKNMFVYNLFGDPSIKLYSEDQTSPEIKISPKQIDVTMEQDAESSSVIRILNGLNKPLNWNTDTIQLRNALGQSLPPMNKYRWIDSNMEKGPSYNWKNISSTAQRVHGLLDDNFQGPFQLHFPFEFYGQTYQSFYICSNGFIAFGPMSWYHSRYKNGPIPGDRTPSNIIAWCWDDLHPRDATVYVQSDQDQAIIQFNDYGQYHTDGTITAQIILKNNDEILFQYQQVQNRFEIDSNTIGLVNKDNSDGLMISFNQRYIADKLALKMDRDLSRATIIPESGTVNMNDETILQVQFFSYGLDVGKYTGLIKLGFDDPDMSNIHIPINLTIQQNFNTNTIKEMYPVTHLHPYNDQSKWVSKLKHAERSMIHLNNRMEKPEACVSQSPQPLIIVTKIPEYQNRVANLKGRIENIVPAECHIAVYIYKDGWKNKPNNSFPATLIQENGQWECDITTVYEDHLATEIALFLLKKDMSPVMMNGENAFPKSFEKKALHMIFLKR